MLYTCLISANFKLSKGVDGTFEDSGDDQHQGRSALKCKNAHAVV